MGKFNLSEISKETGRFLSKNAPGILTGLGISGMFLAIGLAVDATIKSTKLVEEKKKEVGVDKLEPKEVVKTVWKYYIPTAALVTTSTACLIGANSVSGKRNAALAAGYEFTRSAFKDYRAKVVETIGEKKEEVIRDKVAKEKIEKNPVSGREVIITDMGDCLCYDTLSGRYFKTDINKIKSVEIDLNLKLINDNYVSLNDFYEGVGLERNKLGDDLGWNIDDGKIELHYSSQLAQYDRPCLVIMYNVSPKHNYWKMC